MKPGIPQASSAGRPEITQHPNAAKTRPAGRQRRANPRRAPRTTAPAAAPADADNYVSAWWNSGNRETYLHFGPQPAERIAAMRAALKEQRTVPSRVGKETLRVLREALSSHPDYRVRFVAAMSLGEVGGSADARYLRAALADSNKRVAASAALGLGLLGLESEEGTLEKLARNPKEDTRKRGYALVGLGFIAAGMRERAEISGESAEDVEQSAPFRAIAATVRHFLNPVTASTERIEMGVAACAASERMGSAAPASDLLALTRAPNIREEIASSAASALGKSRSPAALDGLVALLLGNRRGLRPHKSAQVRASAAMAIGQYTSLDPRAVQAVAAPLSERLNKSNRAVYERDLFARCQTLIALARLGRNHPRILPGVWDVVRGKLVDGGIEEQGYAAYAAAILLGNLDKHAGAKEKAAHARARKSAVATLAAKLQRGDATVRGAAAQALGLLQAREALPMLRRIATTPKYVNRNEMFPQVLYAIGMMGDIHRDGPLLEGILNANKKKSAVVWNSVIALGLLYDGRDLPPAFKVYLENQSSEIRGAIIVALGVTRNPKSAALLAGRYDKEDHDFLRAKIVAALGEIGSRFGCSAWSVTARDHNFKLNGTLIRDLF